MIIAIDEHPNNGQYKYKATLRHKESGLSVTTNGHGYYAYGSTKAEAISNLKEDIFQSMKAYERLFNKMMRAK